MLVNRWLEIEGFVDDYVIEKSLITFGRKSNIADLIDIQLDDQWVSKKHAHLMISNRDNKVYIFDGIDQTPSRNGTIVNGTVYRKFDIDYSKRGVELHHGDEITIGRTLIKYYEEYINEDNRQFNEYDTWL